jgi:hypothetical protein
MCDIMESDWLVFIDIARMRVLLDEPVGRGLVGRAAAVKPNSPDDAG